MKKKYDCDYGRSAATSLKSIEKGANRILGSWLLKVDTTVV
jgi:hypothetical protein